MVDDVVESNLTVQWLNATKVVITGPDTIVPGLSRGLEAEGHVYTEATFIS